MKNTRKRNSSAEVPGKVPQTKKQMLSKPPCDSKDAEDPSFEGTTCSSDEGTPEKSSCAERLDCSGEFSGQPDRSAISTEKRETIIHCKRKRNASGEVPDELSPAKKQMLYKPPCDSEDEEPAPVAWANVSLPSDTNNATSTGKQETTIPLENPRKRNASAPIPGKVPPTKKQMRSKPCDSGDVEGDVEGDIENLGFEGK
jgi:hypothetical protein